MRAASSGPLGGSERLMGTGLMIALFAVGVSAADVLAIGDAENDFDLLKACGWSARPENALPR